jgi:hypothetical protein
LLRGRVWYNQLVGVLTETVQHQLRGIGKHLNATAHNKWSAKADGVACTTPRAEPFFDSLLAFCAQALRSSSLEELQLTGAPPVRTGVQAV